MAITHDVITIALLVNKKPETLPKACYSDIFVMVYKEAWPHLFLWWYRHMCYEWLVSLCRLVGFHFLVTILMNKNKHIRSECWAKLAFFVLQFKMDSGQLKGTGTGKNDRLTGRLTTVLQSSAARRDKHFFLAHHKLFLPVLPLAKNYGYWPTGITHVSLNRIRFSHHFTDCRPPSQPLCGLSRMTQRNGIAWQQVPRRDRTEYQSTLLFSPQKITVWSEKCWVFSRSDLVTRIF